MKASNKYASSDLLTVPQVAARMAVSPSLVYQLIESGKLGHHRIGNGRGTIRVSQNDLEAYLSASHSGVEPLQPTVRRPRKRLKHIRL